MLVLMAARIFLVKRMGHQTVNLLQNKILKIVYAYAYANISILYTMSYLFFSCELDGAHSFQSKIAMLERDIERRYRL